MALEQTWRWYGENDPISLAEIKQTGATGIVSALHHIPNGELWPLSEILKHKRLIEEAGLRWSVVESVPVHEDIKKKTNNYQLYIENYKQSIRHLAEAGIHTICYNFMPVLDWSRTHLKHQCVDGSLALSFQPEVFAAFDLFILKREAARNDYSEDIISQAENYYQSISQEEKQELIDTILLGLPGSEESFTLSEFKEQLQDYKNIGAKELKAHLMYFLKEIIPIAQASDVRMAIHPDDPPRPLFGLPRVVSTIDDISEILNAVDTVSNGLTLCTGSLGAGYYNDVATIARTFAHRINFAHLRDVSNNDNGFFREEHLFEGNIDIYGVMRELILEERRRIKAGREDWQIPIRPDHGHLMLDDIEKEKTYPGYSLIGRMKGLAELRGLEIGIIKSLYHE